MSKGFGTKKPQLAGLFNIKVRNQTDPYITEVEKKDGQWVGVQEAKDITGDLHDFRFDSYEYRDEKVDTLEMIMDIGREAPVKVQMNVDNGMGRSLINTLSGIENLPGKELSINVYTNKGGYASIYIEVDGEKVSWKFDVDKIKSLTPDRWVAMGEKFIVEQFKDYTFSNESVNIDGNDFPTASDEPGQTEQEVLAEEDDLPF